MIPVFVFPSDQLQFNLRARSRSLSLYNPYDFHIKFNILSTNPNAFLLSSSEGIIRSRHCLDIAIRLTQDSVRSEKFQISIRETSGALRSGQRVLCVTNRDDVADDDTTPSADDHFSPVVANNSQQTARAFNAEPKNQWFIYAAAVVCLAVLLLPTDDEREERPLLAVAVAHKLVVLMRARFRAILVLLTADWFSSA
ncbi:unnamed protein product, partial [Medioppia subpectinata]